MKCFVFTQYPSISCSFIAIGIAHFCVPLCRLCRFCCVGTITESNRPRVRPRAHVLRLTCSLLPNYTFFFSFDYSVFLRVSFGYLIHIVSSGRTRISEYVLELREIFSLCFLNVTSGSRSLFVFVQPP